MMGTSNVNRRPTLGRHMDKLGRGLLSTPAPFWEIGGLRKGRLHTNMLMDNPALAVPLREIHQCIGLTDRPIE
jgi:hypothetical protein